MIEVIYNEETARAKENAEIVKLPKNVRQIGEIKSRQKIYMEDYVYTFLKKIARNPHGDETAAILYGSCHWTEQGVYLFIRSALQIRDLELSPEHIRLDDKVWSQVYEDGKKYFPEQEIVGWFASFPGFSMQINEEIRKTHLNHFGGNDKVLFLMEPGEMEEAFYAYENNQMVRILGHYIYYEKNEPMQTYMIDMSENKSIEETEGLGDRAVADFRKTVNEKKQEVPVEKEKNKIARTRWLAGACSAAAMLIVGVGYLNQYREATDLTKVQNREVLTTETVHKEMADQPLISSAQLENGNTSLMKEQAGMEEETSVLEKETDEENTEKEQIVEREQNKDSEIEEGEERFQNDTELFEDSSTLDTEQGGESEESGLHTGANTTRKSTTKEETSAAVAGKTISYTIQKGDTLTSICQERYGTIQRIEEICRLNGISSEDLIFAGQKLLLPEQ